MKKLLLLFIMGLQILYGVGIENSISDKTVTDIIKHKEIKTQIERGQSHHYKIVGKKGETLKITLNSSGGDADLRVKIGRKANYSTFDCKSINGFEKEDQCRLTLKEDASLYINVYGYSDVSYSLLVSKEGTFETYFGKKYRYGNIHWRVVKVTPSGKITPKGATIKHYRSEIMGKIYVRLQGEGRKNSYLFGNKRDTHNFYKKKLFPNKKISFYMKFSEKYRIVFYAKTKEGYRTFYLTYSEKANSFEKGKYIYLNLGRKSMNNKWQKYSFDFEKELQKYEPNNEIIVITGMKVKGSGRITNPMLTYFNGTGLRKKVTLQNGKVLQVSKNSVKKENGDTDVEMVVSNITDKDNPKVLIKQRVARYKESESDLFYGTYNSFFFSYDGKKVYRKYGYSDDDDDDYDFIVQYDISNLSNAKKINGYNLSYLPGDRVNNITYISPSIFLVEREDIDDYIYLYLLDTKTMKTKSIFDINIPTYSGGEDGI